MANIQPLFDKILKKKEGVLGEFTPPRSCFFYFLIFSQALTLGVLWGGTALADLPPRLQAAPGEGRHGVKVAIQGGEVDHITVLAPWGVGEEASKPLAMPWTGQSFTMGRGGYHWLYAIWRQGHEERVASTVHYVPLPGPSPRRLLAATKHDLEVLPHPLPRERQSYRGGESWPFLVRFQGRPLANAAVVLAMAEQPPASFKTDDQGIVRVLFPIPTVQKGARQGSHSRRGPQFPFTLQVAHQQQEQHYLTTFSYTLSPPPDSDLPLGAGVSVMGFVLGGVLLHRRRKGT